MGQERFRVDSSGNTEEVNNQIPEWKKKLAGATGKSQKELDEEARATRESMMKEFRKKHGIE